MKLKKYSALLLSIILNLACTQAQKQEPLSPQQRPSQGNLITIGQKIKLQSEVLGEEKEIYVSLPPKYNERVHSYPVVYVLEAEFLFESAHTIAKMMAARSKMPQSIIVGLANGEFKKRHELSLKKWKGKPDEYIEFFSTELIPYIEENYRANEHRTIIGLSPTNGFVFEAFLSQPELFKGYIALAAHLEWDRINGTRLIDEIITESQEANRPQTTLYMGRADSDLNDHPEAKAAYLDATEKLKDIQFDQVTYKIDVIPNEEHYLMSLAGIRAGLELIYPNSLWKNPGWIGWDKNANYADDYYRKYFGELSDIYGFEIYPIEDGHAYGFYLTGKIYNAQNWGTNQQVIELAELGIEYYPNSANIHMTLAEAYKKSGHNDLAASTGDKAMELVTRYHPEEIESFKERYQKLVN